MTARQRLILAGECPRMIVFVNLAFRMCVMRIKEGISPVAVANYLLEKDAKSACAGMDQLKLIKLVYICHGFHLAEFGKPLWIG